MNALNVRTRCLIPLIVLGFPGLLTAADTAAAPYAKDVDFLLKALRIKAGHFFCTKQIDWNAVSTEFRRSAEGITDDVAHAKLCSRLLAQLKDGHAQLTDLKIPMPDEAKGRRFTGPRVHLVPIGRKIY